MKNNGNKAALITAKNDALWLEMFARFKLYIKDHEKYPSKRSNIADEKKLAFWISVQRVDQNTLKHSRITALNDINFKWGSPIISKWPRKFEDFKTFININKREPLLNSIENLEARLAQWARTQRTTLDEADSSNPRVAALNKINFQWSLRQAWADRLNEYKTFLDINGRHPKRLSTITSEKALATWVSSQRLEIDSSDTNNPKVFALNEIGFDWGSHWRDNGYGDWSTRFSEYKQFIKANNKNPSRQSKCAIEKSLGIWEKSQRQNIDATDLKNPKVIALNKIGFPWEGKTLIDKWQQSFDIYFKFLQSKNRQPSSTDKNEIALYYWAYSQRKKLNQSDLTDPKVMKLKAMNFKWQLKP